jgi:hypothetical protein
MVILPALRPYDFGRRRGDLAHRTALATIKTMMMKMKTNDKERMGMQLFFASDVVLS